jgi:hypothetical protein
MKNNYDVFNNVKFCDNVDDEYEYQGGYYDRFSKLELSKKGDNAVRKEFIENCEKYGFEYLWDHMKWRRMVRISLNVYCNPVRIKQIVKFLLELIKESKKTYKYRKLRKKINIAICEIKKWLKDEKCNITKIAEDIDTTHDPYRDGYVTDPDTTGIYFALRSIGDMSNIENAIETIADDLARFHSYFGGRRTLLHHDKESCDTNKFIANLFRYYVGMPFLYDRGNPRKQQIIKKKYKDRKNLGLFDKKKDWPKNRPYAWLYN